MLPETRLSRDQLLRTELDGQYSLLFNSYFPGFQPYAQPVQNYTFQEQPAASQKPIKSRGMAVCPHCDKQFTNERGVKQHIGKVHFTEERQAACDVCGKKFRNKYAVKFHVNQVHSQATRMSCIVCGQEQYNQYVLMQHQAKKHPGFLLSLRITSTNI